MKVLTLDIGATIGRATIVTYEDKCISYQEIYRFHTNFIRQKDALYWDFTKIFDHVKYSINLALDLEPNILSVGIDTFGIDYGIIGKSGQLLKNPRSYQDERTIESSSQALKLMPFKEIYQETGIQFMKMNTIFQLFDDQNGNENLLERCDKILLLPDLIAYFLTGVKRMEITNCSTTGLYNPESKKISQTILSKLKIPAHIFPSFIIPGENYGFIKQSFLNKNINLPLVATCTHSTASAILGTGRRKNFLYLVSGTWSLLGTELDKPIINEESEKYNFTNEIGYGQTIRYLKNIMGMFILNEIRKEWKSNGNEIPLEKVSKIALETPDINSYIDPDFEAFRSPFNMILKVKTYLRNTSQSIPTFQGQWIRLIYQSMACKYRYIYEKLISISHLSFDEIIIVGGGAKATLLNQYIANVLGIKVIAGDPEATTLGNALIQFISHREIEDLTKAQEILRNSVNEKIYYPQDQELWNDKYHQFLNVNKLN